MSFGPALLTVQFSLFPNRIASHLPAMWQSNKKIAKEIPRKRILSSHILWLLAAPFPACPSLFPLTVPSAVTPVTWPQTLCPAAFSHTLGLIIHRRRAHKRSSPYPQRTQKFPLRPHWECEERGTYLSSSWWPPLPSSRREEGAEAGSRDDPSWRAVTTAAQLSTEHCVFCCLFLVPPPGRGSQCLRRCARVFSVGSQVTTNAQAGHWGLGIQEALLPASARAYCSPLMLNRGITWNYVVQCRGCLLCTLLTSSIPARINGPTALLGEIPEHRARISIY